MSAPLSTPAGYCPVCGYRMNPGICPECGSAVLPDDLKKSNPVERRRRLIRGALLSFTVLIIAGAVIYVVNSDRWLKWFPSNVLLMVQADNGGKVTTELVARHSAGKLNTAQSDRLFLRIAGPLRIRTRSPYPRGFPIFAVLESVTTAGPRPSLAIVAADLRIDGDVVPYDLDTYAYFSEYFQRAQSGIHLFTSPGLPPGRYELSVTGSLRVSVGTLGGIFAIRQGIRVPKPFTAATYATHSIPIKVTQPIVVDDRTFEEHVGLKWSPVLADAVRRRVTLSGEPIPEMLFRFDGTPVGIVSHLEVRELGEPVFWRTGSIIGAGLGWSGTRTVGLTPTPGLDIRLVPDAGWAFWCGHRDIFAGSIEWSGVTFGDPDGAGPPGPGAFRRPTAVRSPAELLLARD